MKKDINSILAVALIMLPILASCRKDLCYNHYPAIDVSLSWEKEWERDYGMSPYDNWDSEVYGFDYDKLRPSTPEWVNMVRYSSDGTPTETFLSPYGGEVILQDYSDQSFLFYNGDTEYIVLSDIGSSPYARASATPRSRSSISYITERHPDVRSMNPPDILYSAFIEKIPDVKIHETLPMPVKMQPLVFTYVVRYEFECGQENIALARGAIGGLAAEVYLRDGRTSDESSIILYDCTIKPYGCEALVRSFGIPGFPDEYYGRSADKTPERLYTLNLEVMLKNGKTFEFNYDISEQLEKQPRGGVIKVTGLRIEEKQAEPDPMDSGFDADVTSWPNNEIIDLPLDLEIPANNEK